MNTLVLDTGYQPVARVSWMRAVTLLWAGKVEVVEEYQDWTVHSVTVQLAVPSVVRFMRGVRPHKKHVRFSREQVFARDGGRCQYCDRPLTRPTETYDHVVPRAQGGRTGWDNIVIACVRCNQRKGGRTPQQAGMVLKRAPVKPQSMADGVRITFEPGMPVSWKAWLRDYQYWHAELEHDG